MGEWTDDEDPWDEVGAYSEQPRICLTCKRPLSAHVGFKCPVPQESNADAEGERHD